MGPNANSTNATPFSFLCQFSHKSGMKQLSGKPATAVAVPTAQPGTTLDMSSSLPATQSLHQHYNGAF